MAEYKFELNCPLCGRAAEAVLLPERRSMQVECPRCTTYVISDELIKIIDSPSPGRHAALLSAAARRRTHGAQQAELPEICHTFTADNYLKVTFEEGGFEDRIRPVVEYLADEGLTLDGHFSREGFELLEVITPGGTRTLKVESHFLVLYSPKEIKTYCRAKRIADSFKTAVPGESVEIYLSPLLPRPPKTKDR